MIVDIGMYYFFIVVLAISLVANIIMAGLLVRWIDYAKQYKGMWKDAIRPIKPLEWKDPYEDQKRSIQYEYFEGMD